MWTNEERLKSSTWRELKAVVLTLKGFSDHFQNKFVKLFTDNQNVARVYEVGSMKKDLHELALEILYFCIKKSIYLKIEWIPRNLNTVADEYSRIFDFVTTGRCRIEFFITSTKFGDRLLLIASLTVITRN